MIVLNEEELRKENKYVNLKEEVNEIIYLLEKELSLTSGIGLAAPQIGINKKIAIVRIGKEKINLVNPIIIYRFRPIISKEEGCLSFPNKRLNVLRFEELFVKDDIHPNGIVLTGLESIAVEHEIDHLNGILFIDKAIDKKIGRNDLCPCGLTNQNGKRIKFKNCHGKI